MGIMTLWMPILASSVIVFTMSALVWTVLPWHKKDFKQTANEEAVRSDLVMETVQAWSRADTIRQQMGIYEATLIPQAKQAYRSTVSAFASG